MPLKNINFVQEFERKQPLKMTCLFRNTMIIMSFLIFQNYKKRIESEGKYYDFVTKELKFDKYI